MIIESKKIVLRDWNLDDLTDYVDWNTGHHPWMDYDAPYFDKMNSYELDEYVKRVRIRILNQNFSNPRKNLIIADKKTNQLLGSVSWYWQSQETNWMSNGLVIYNNAYWGQGIGFEALKLWNTYLFNSFEEIIRLDLRTWSGNKGMMQLAEKLGYKLEARFRKARVIDGVYYDSIGYGVLRNEWKWF